MTMKKLKKTKPPHLTKGLIGNYHLGFIIEHAKYVLKKGWYRTRCWQTYQLPLSKQRDGEMILQASLYEKSLNKSTVKMEVYI